MKERRKKKGNERQKSVYIEGDTASVDWSGLWFVGLFYGFFLSILFRQGVQTIAVCCGRDGITNVYFLPNHILNKTIPLFCRIFPTDFEVKSFKGWKLPVSVAT